MAYFIFSTSPSLATGIVADPKPRTLSDTLVGFGVAKSVSEASAILVGLSFLLFAASVLLLDSSMTPPAAEPSAATEREL